MSELDTRLDQMIIEARRSGIEAMAGAGLKVDEAMRDVHSTESLVAESALALHGAMIESTTIRGHGGRIARGLRIAWHTLANQRLPLDTRVVDVTREISDWHYDSDIEIVSPSFSTQTYPYGDSIRTTGFELTIPGLREVAGSALVRDRDPMPYWDTYRNKLLIRQVADDPDAQEPVYSQLYGVGLTPSQEDVHGEHDEETQQRMERAWQQLKADYDAARKSKGEGASDEEVATRALLTSTVDLNDLSPPRPIVGQKEIPAGTVYALTAAERLGKEDAPLFALGLLLQARKAFRV